MGLISSTCSHENVVVKDLDPKTYTDKSKTWTFQIGKLKCLNCNLEFNGIKRKCIDHNHQHPWEIVSSHDCKHDVIVYENSFEKNSPSKRAKCIICKTSVPLAKNSNNLWYVDNIKWLNENKHLQPKLSN